MLDHTSPSDGERRHTALGTRLLMYLADIANMPRTMGGASAQAKTLAILVLDPDLSDETRDRLADMTGDEVRAALRVMDERHLTPDDVQAYVLTRVGPGPAALRQPSLFMLEDRRQAGLDTEYTPLVESHGFDALARVRDREGRDIDTQAARVARVLLMHDFLGGLSPRASARIERMTYHEIVGMACQLGEYALPDTALVAIAERSAAVSPVHN